MSDINYRAAFWKHKAHYVLAGACATVLLVSGHIFGAIVGITGYIIGLINIPDMKFFRNMVDKERKEVDDKIQEAKVAEFKAKRDRQLEALTRSKKECYANAAYICKDIEEAIGYGDGQSLVLSKIDELMWTYLKLLSIHQFLEKFIEIERQENLEESIKEVQDEAASLAKEIEKLKAAKQDQMASHKQKLLLSVEEKLNTIRKRFARLQEAKNNIEVVSCEEARLIEQIKLLRSDAIATKNAEGLSLKIDATVEHLDQTNQWLSEMKDFQDFSDEIPAGVSRIGYADQRQAVSDPEVPSSITMIEKNRVRSSTYN